MNKKWGVVLFAVLCLLHLSCNTPRLSKTNVESIYIAQNNRDDKGELLKGVTITDAKEITIIIDSINKSISEPIKFYPKIRMEIKYQTEVIQAGVSEGCLKVSGKTYRTTTYLHRFLDSYLSERLK